MSIHLLELREGRIILNSTIDPKQVDVVDKRHLFFLLRTNFVISLKIHTKSSVGDPNDFFRIRILFFRPIRIRIRLLSDPDPNRFGFGSES